MSVRPCSNLPCPQSNGHRGVEEFRTSMEAYDRLVCLIEMGRRPNLCSTQSGRYAICYRAAPVVGGQYESAPPCYSVNPSPPLPS